MKSKSQLLSCKFEDAYWLRPEGKGSFITSPAVEDAAGKKISAGIRKIIIDLEACLGMDSTFMGMLAGISKSLRKNQGELTIVGASEKNCHSLEELGLNALMKIDPDGPPNLEEIRGAYEVSNVTTGPGGEDHILECHEILSDVDEKNEKTFQSVLEVLQKKRNLSR